MKDSQEQISMRPPADEKERMKAALCSTIDDLLPDGNGRVVVTGVLPKGDRIYLGEIDEELFYLKGIDPIEAVNRVRFGATKRLKPSEVQAFLDRQRTA